MGQRQPKQIDYRNLDSDWQSDLKRKYDAKEVGEGDQIILLGNLVETVLKVDENGILVKRPEGSRGKDATGITQYECSPESKWVSGVWRGWTDKPIERYSDIPWEELKR